MRIISNLRDLFLGCPLSFYPLFLNRIKYKLIIGPQIFYWMKSIVHTGAPPLKRTNTLNLFVL